MSFFSKVLKGVTKLVRPGVALATGGLSEKAIQVGKGIGSLIHNAKKSRVAAKAAAIKIEPVSVRAVIAKNAVPTAIPINQNVATTMPGGAPLKQTRKRKATVAKKSTAKKPRGKSGGASSKRKAPSGGKDFKALSASWKAAGKPGTWLDWVKSH